MSNPKHVQLEPQDAAKLAAVLVDLQATTPKYFKKKGLTLQLLRLKKEIRRVNAQYEQENEE